MFPVLPYALNQLSSGDAHGDLMKPPIKSVSMFGSLLLIPALVPAVSSAATPPVTSTNTFDITCQVTPSASIVDPLTVTTEAAIQVTAPETVETGEVFTVDLQVDGVSVPTSFEGISATDVSRIKLDLDVPDNAEFVSAQVLDPGSFTAGVTPSVIRIDENGVPSADGDYLRLSGGNQTIGNGPSVSRTTPAGMAVRPSGGDETTLTFPRLRLVFEAGEPGVIEPGIRTDGQAGVFGSDESFVSLLARANAPIIGTVSAPVTCQPRDSATAALNEGAGPLTTIDVLEPGPIDPGSVITRLDGPSSVDVGQAVSFAANVGVAEEDDTIADLDGGDVQFYADGAPIGEPRPVVRGIARLDMTFNVPGTKLVTAEYTDADGSSAPLSNVHVLTVIGPDPEPTDPVDPAPSEPTGGSLASIFGSLSAS